jgi:transposase
LDLGHWVKLENINIDETLKEAESLLSIEKDISPALLSMIKIMITLLKLLTNQIGLNSSNSSKPPSSDPNRLKPTRKKSNKKPGGQKGHLGTTLKQVEEPDEVKVIKIDQRTLPKGITYKEVGFDKRQVFDIDISRFVTEYQAQILEDENGNRYVAEFPENISVAIQYGNALKAHAVYMSQHQLLPYKRIEEYFTDQLQIPISQGSIFNFNKVANKHLSGFESIVKDMLASSSRMNVDETSVNINGDRFWLHSAGNDLWTYYFPHEKRGCEAIDEMNIIPRFKGILCHDHWKPYYTYDGCLHALCNAHHLRELTRAHEQDKQEWAEKMKVLLEEFNIAVNNAGGSLDKAAADKNRKRYRELLEEAKLECPPPDESKRNGKRGRLKRSKARNLLERFINYEDDVLRFMGDADVPFTNNQGENDIRMTKVQQKISGCFRSMEGAKIFCRVRGYLSTCRKHGVSSSHALEMLFEEKLPDFI